MKTIEQFEESLEQIKSALHQDLRENAERIKQIQAKLEGLSLEEPTEEDLPKTESIQQEEITEIDEEKERRAEQEALSELRKNQSEKDYQLSKIMLKNAINNLKIKQKHSLN